MILLLSVRFLDNRYHGLTDNGERAEWPPSPFRLFQAMIAGNARGLEIPQDIARALQWLEELDAPLIVAPESHSGRTLLTYVLNNVESHSRTPKTIRPTLLNGDRLLQYCWTFDAREPDAATHAATITDAARHLRALGWGIDLAIGHGEVVTLVPAVTKQRTTYRPLSIESAEGLELRTPRRGSFQSLCDTYADSLKRYESPGITNLESSGAIYQTRGYAVGQARPFTVFALRTDDDQSFRYPHARVIHIAGMVRHAAIEAMKKYPPPSIADPDAWVRSYVAGHQSPEDKQADKPHAQFSYLPLPSIGMEHTDPSVRRVMIAAPIGDDEYLEHLAMLLDGKRLNPLANTSLSAIPTLIRIRSDGVTSAYTRPSNAWASVTPVILPGHDDHKEKKTAELICKALKQSGVEAPCTFEWSAISHFPKSLTAHKYRRDPNNPDKKIQINYIRPDHLLDKTGVHLKLTFNDSVRISGPIVIGCGRHCGLGIMAGIATG